MTTNHTKQNKASSNTRLTIADRDSEFNLTYIFILDWHVNIVGDGGQS